MKLRTVIIGTFSVALLTFAMTAHAKIYRWVGADGVVHFSQLPPDNGQKATQISDTPISVTSGPPAAATSTTKAPASGKDNTQQAASQKKNAQTNTASVQRACAAARTNLTALQSGKRVKERLPDGTTKWLDEAQRTKRLQQTRSFIDKHCK
ncbi:DUF4124 domain-containing protein [Acidihalobacter ferrooxydans]|uniref:DUF4124 domain-containing protein n=1 Tax=Acidihalobacter ferrooxydans TaxID=1765967 RepID=A0A1P8UJ90_9GAMM|nr:DUF4124 domain-containing protein [Acidihalobacter ferrooxydans]APZ43915.1 hypothetical protein BW247_13125 [Acidihalobacter ferrooxydans]